MTFISLIIVAAAAGSQWDWNEIGRVAIPLGAIFGAVSILIGTLVKIKGWMDQTYVTRLEFQQFITDIARYQKVERRKTKNGRYD